LLLLLLPTLGASFYPENVAFLSSVSSTGASQYNQIVNNQQSTRSQMEQQLNQWASQYGMTSQVTQLINARASMLKNISDTATTDAQNLPSLIQKLYNVANSPSLTSSQVETQMRLMLDSATPGQKKMATSAFGIDLGGSTNGNGNGGFGNGNNGGFGNGNNGGFGNGNNGGSGNGNNGGFGTGNNGNNGGFGNGNTGGFGNGNNGGFGTGNNGGFGNGNNGGFGTGNSGNNGGFGTGN
ncbi:hypothetical protein PENTCL1PPCAC_23976, partial [Pristionchus entomophagus]